MLHFVALLFCFASESTRFFGKIHDSYACTGDCSFPMMSMQMDALSFKKMDFTEFCAAAISVHQLEGTDRWEQHARAAYDIFEKEGNRVISVEELARVRIIFLHINRMILVDSF